MNLMGLLGKFVLANVRVNGIANGASKRVLRVTFIADLLGPVRCGTEGGLRGYSMRNAGGSVRLWSGRFVVPHSLHLMSSGWLLRRQSSHLSKLLPRLDLILDKDAEFFGRRPRRDHANAIEISLIVWSGQRVGKRMVQCRSYVSG